MRKTQTPLPREMSILAFVSLFRSGKLSRVAAGVPVEPTKGQIFRR